MIMCEVWRKINNVWQDKWDRESKRRHLHQIQNKVSVGTVGSGNRREEIILTRLRLGHCVLNKTLKIRGVARQICVRDVRKSQWIMLL